MDGRKEDAKNLTRRELLAGGLRWLAAGALVAAGATMTGKNLLRRGDRQAETCINEFICRDCSAVSGCRLPQAMSYRQNTRGAERD